MQGLYLCLLAPVSAASSPSACDRGETSESMRMTEEDRQPRAIYSAWTSNLGHHRMLGRGSLNSRPESVCHRSHPMSQKINRACPEAQRKGYRIPKCAWESEAEKHGGYKRSQDWKNQFHLCSSKPGTLQSLFGKELMKIIEHEMTFHQLISVKEEWICIFIELIKCYLRIA